jgi:hypothetical protein
MGSLNVACSAAIDLFRCKYFRESIPVTRNIIANTASIGVQAYFGLLVVTARLPTWAFIGSVIGVNVLLPCGVSKLVKFLFDRIDKESRLQNAKGVLGFPKNQNDISPDEISKRFELVRTMVNPEMSIEQNSTELTQYLSILHEVKEFLLKKQTSLLYITYSK